METTKNPAKKHVRTKVRLSLGDRIYKAIVFTVVTLFGLACFYPILSVVMYSVIPYVDYIRAPLNIIPKSLDWSAYEQLLKFDLLYSGYKNSIFITLVGTIINISLMCLSAYPLSKPDLKGRNVVLGFITVTSDMWMDWLPEGAMAGVKVYNLVSGTYHDNNGGDNIYLEEGTYAIN